MVTVQTQVIDCAEVYILNICVVGLFIYKEIERDNRSKKNSGAFPLCMACKGQVNITKATSRHFIKDGLLCLPVSAASQLWS